MIEAKSVKSQTRQELVRHKPVTAFFHLIVFAPIAPDRHDLLIVVINGNDIGQGDSVIVLILFIHFFAINAVEQIIDVHFQQCDYVIIAIVVFINAFDFANNAVGWIDIVAACIAGLEVVAVLNIAIVVVLRHSNEVSIAWGCVEVFALWSHAKVFCLDELAALPVEVYVPPNLFERLADQR